ncbi:MAG: cytochrome C oxidase subunit IV family protein [Acidimicrobiales bacterium]
MSTGTGPLASPTDTISPPVGQGHGVEDEHHHGLSDGGYVRIALILATITAAEVIWSYLPWWDDATGATRLLEVGGLLVMMAVKFVMVAANFMHLKFDDKVLTRLFYAGLVLAVTVYVIALITFHVFY